MNYASNVNTISFVGNSILFAAKIPVSQEATYCEIQSIQLLLDEG